MNTGNNIDYIERLEALQETIPSLEALVSAMKGTFVQYKMDKGFAVGNGVLYDQDCAVQKYFVTGNSEFPKHTHDEYEYFIVIEGEGIVTIGDNTKPFKSKDCIIIEPGQTHSWFYSTPAKMIAIIIPASKGYPHDEG